MWMLRYCCLSLILLAGCASSPLSEDEQFKRDWKHAMERENWAACERAYEQVGKATLHWDHTHRKHRKIYQWMIKRDLADNNCHYILGKERWAN